MVPKKGLEPPHRCRYMDLNHARLPIPPLRLEEYSRCRAGLAISRTALPLTGTAPNHSNKKAAAARQPKAAHQYRFVCLVSNYLIVTCALVIQLAPAESHAFSVTRCVPVERANKVSTEDALT
jgi:hypothetical protein